MCVCVLVAEEGGDVFSMSLSNVFVYFMKVWMYVRCT